MNVPAGGDLQAALDAARPGETICSNPARPTSATSSCARRIAAATRDRSSSGRPGRTPCRQGERIDAGGGLGAGQDAVADVTRRRLRTAPRARFWRIELVEFLANRGGVGDIITLGDGSSAQTCRDDVPADLVLDRSYIHGDPVAGQKRGIALNSARTTITKSLHRRHHERSVRIRRRSPAGTARADYLIENNYLEAAGENVIFGGADPAILGLTPTRHRRCGAIRSANRSRGEPGSRWQVKNLFELKNARDVVIERNMFERNWQAAQSGFAILFTVRNQDGGCPWCQVEQVEFRQNVVRDVAAGVSILGIDPNHPSRQTNAIVLRDNLFDGIDARAWGGNGYAAPDDGHAARHHPRSQHHHSGHVERRDSGRWPRRRLRLHEQHRQPRHLRHHRERSRRRQRQHPIQLPRGRRATQRARRRRIASCIRPTTSSRRSQEFRRQFFDFDGRDFRRASSEPLGACRNRWARVGRQPPQPPPGSTPRASAPQAAGSGMSRGSIRLFSWNTSAELNRYTLPPAPGKTPIVQADQSVRRLRRPHRAKRRPTAHQ